MNEEKRPNPDSLLDLVNNDRSVSKRGRLKIFFGSSAGVGKTFAMLNEARLRVIDGVDVVIGVVETHGRVDTMAVVKGIPAIPLIETSHRGVAIKEFDLESALKHKPSLILIDELAHNNAPSSRHPKRWQDVDELLNHGIDVYTTLNVQHLESLNDMVAKLTGIQVQETVPDRIFDGADDIALIDIPSDELLKRLKEGKVYIAPNANKRAAENFFKKTNLVALRELALRRTAERVDAQMDLLTSSQGNREAQIGLKILVCVGHDELSKNVIRHAKRIASRARAPWHVVYVETSRHYNLNDKAKLGVERNLRMAEKLGAKVIILKGSNAVDEILNYARNNGFTRIIVGHHKITKGIRIFRGCLSSELIERGNGLEVTALTENKPPEKSYISLWKRWIPKPKGLAFMVFVLAACTLLGLPFRDLTDSNNLTMFFLTGVVIIAAALGTIPAFVASLLSIALFNFFFTIPYYTFSFIDPDYYFTFSVMLVTSLIVGSLAAKLSHQVKQSRKREQEINSLYALTRELSSVRGIKTMAETAIKNVSNAFDSYATIFFLDNNELQIMPKNSLSAEMKEESVARWVLENGQLAGHNTDTMPSAKGLYFPLHAENTIMGVLGVIPKQEDDSLSTYQITQIESFASLIASAFQRARKADEAEMAKVESEGEKLRSTLLSSVSHDLRTPLASITGAASSALLLEAKLPKEVKELLVSIHSQADKLAKLVTNLLDVTSLESGKVKLNTQPYYIQEVIGSALTRIEQSKGKRKIEVIADTKLPLVEIDGLLIEQVLINLLDNAIRYTKGNGKIRIEAELQDKNLAVTISDNGSGITKGEEDKIFEKFYTRGHRTEGNAGLGLAICKGIVLAHNGSITAKNNDSGGASISFTLPL